MKKTNILEIFKELKEKFPPQPRLLEIWVHPCSLNILYQLKYDYNRFFINLNIIEASFIRLGKSCVYGTLENNNKFIKYDVAPLLLETKEGNWIKTLIENQDEIITQLGIKNWSSSLVNNLINMKKDILNIEKIKNKQRTKFLKEPEVKGPTCYLILNRDGKPDIVQIETARRHFYEYICPVCDKEIKVRNSEVEITSNFLAFHRKCLSKLNIMAFGNFFEKCGL